MRVAATTTILIAEDDPMQAQMIGLLLTRKLGYQVCYAADGQEVLHQLSRADMAPVDAILLDIGMPTMDGFEALRAIRRMRPTLPVIMLTAQDDAALAVKAIKQGANDFLTKPVDPAKLDVALINALRLSELADEVRRLQREKEGTLTFHDLIGHQHGLAGSVQLGRKAAGSDVPVLLLGETGVGKELFARAIHGESKRGGGPFVTINCGAIPPNLVESTLFGHEKGSFTGATSRSIGKFREAEGGTIFLDEIGELPLEAQVKLLRVLQEKEVEPVGATRAVPIQVRFISATHCDLSTQMAHGNFREDLYFRLNVLPITLPPLRQRRGDILRLAQHFLKRITMAESLPLPPLTEDAKTYLAEAEWPGNVRELANLLYRALVLQEGASIDRGILQQLHQPMPQPPAPAQNGQPAQFLSRQRADGSHKSMEELEREIIHLTLEACEGNVTRAADLLGMAKSTFYRKIKDA